MRLRSRKLQSTYKSTTFQSYCEQALETFRSFEWPTAQDEEWRRTDIRYLDLDSFDVWNAALETATHKAESAYTAEYRLLSDGSISIAKGDHGVDVYDARLSLIPSPQFEKLRAGYLEVAAHKFSAWNATWASFAPTVCVGPDTHSEKPILIDCELAVDRVVVNSQMHIIVDTGAKASVIVRLRSADAGELLHNFGIAAYLADNASLDLFVIQKDAIDASYIGNVYTQLHNDARMQFVGMNKGALLSKYTIYSDIQGKGSETQMDGIFYPHNDEHIDIRSVQRHRVGKSYSRALFKGAVCDEAHSVFQGLIHVDPGADDTDAYLTNNNLVLSQTARADSIPTLQIETNNLRCSHGATVGRIDQEQLMYLCTRGIDPDSARSLLVEGHFEEIVSLFPGDLSDTVRAHMLL